MHTGTDVTAPLAHQAGGPLQGTAGNDPANARDQPRDATTVHQMGLLAHQRGDAPAAAELIRQAIAMAPRTAAFHGSLGIVLLGMQRAQEAAAAFRTAIRLQPGDFGAHAYLGAALAALGDYDGAAKAAGATLRLRPGDAAALHMRGVCEEKAGRYGQALATLDAAILADPASYTARLSRAALLLAMGRTPEALDAFDAAIPLCPSDTRARQSRILAMNYLPGSTMRDIADTARRLAPAAPVGYVPASFPDRDRSPGRPLRIGYVSGDFRNHPVGYFLHSVFAARDPQQVVVSCYSNTQVEDPMTARLKALVDHWQPIFNLDDAQVAAAIRADDIDILVDLAGHTNSNRLSVFALRAAPVQAAWLGYFGTTGLAAMDVVIADRHVLPPCDEPTFGERVVRLPDSYLCFSPPAEAGPVAPLPAGLEQPITFGCFNSRAKLNPGVLAVWARILAAVPRSRLLLKAAQYSDKILRREIAHAFAASGIPPERIQFEPASPIAAMFDAYGRVDIALDPFPFAGGATTAQALWMGVPVVSLVGATWPGRQGASLLHAAGFPDWAVSDADSYVALARRLAMDRPGLVAVRRTLRAAVADSPLCQADRFARHLEAAFRNMWRVYLQASA
ncbi:MAG: tetratricopeptide repeat protein [Acetobacteraceae bacterium]|nr:tetratricopeptide repeat protein [Acetobacteraceae bacterium]